MIKQLDLWDLLASERMLNADEIFEQADADMIRKLVEDRRIERKSAKFSGDSLGEYICMWANTAPEGGLIALGVVNKEYGEDAYEGCLSLSQQQVNNIEKAGHVFCPDAKVQTKQVPVRNRNGKDDFIILLRVKYSPDIVVKNTSGKIFVRIADTLVELKTPEEISELQADKGVVSFEQRPCDLSYPEDFNESEISKFVATVRKARRMNDSLNTVDVLSLRRLGKMSQGIFVPNIACALLFGKDPCRLIPGCKVHFQRFEGEDEKTGKQFNTVKDEFIEGSVQQILQQTDELLESQLRVFSPLNDKGKFFPVPEYPREAWLEAVVNACVHRSYGNGMKNMPIFVKMFDDRLVIESPGPFPPFVTAESIYEAHQPRNPILMESLFYLEITRCNREGAKRIRDTMVAMALPKPEFKQAEIGPSMVRVTLRNNIKQRRAWIDRDVSLLVSEAIAADLTEDEKRVLNWAAENESIRISDANKLLDTSWQSARRLLLELAQKRIFQYIRFVPFERDKRDVRAYFRLRSTKPLPKGAFEQNIVNEISVKQWLEAEHFPEDQESP